MLTFFKIHLSLVRVHENHIGARVPPPVYPDSITQQYITQWAQYAAQVKGLLTV